MALQLRNELAEVESGSPLLSQLIQLKRQVCDSNKEAAEAERKREEAEHKNVLLEKVRQNFVNEKCANHESFECSKSKRTSLIHLECFNPTHQNKLWSVLHNFWCRWSYWQTCLSMMNSLKGMPKCLGYARTH